MMATSASRRSRRGYAHSCRRLGKEVTRWSGQVLDTIDYCAFIGLNPGSKSVYVVTGDSGQGMTHGALAGLLLKDLISGQSNPWAEVYEPSRKTPSGVINYVRENLSVVKNLAGYVLPGDLKSAGRAVRRPRRDFARRPTQDRRLSRHGRKAASAFGRLHAFGMRGGLELDRAVLGLLMPWFAFRTGWDGLEWSGRAFASTHGHFRV